MRAQTICFAIRNRSYREYFNPSSRSSTCATMARKLVATAAIPLDSLTRSSRASRISIPCSVYEAIAASYRDFINRALSLLQPKLPL